MDEAELKFCQEKANELEEHYKILVNATKAHLYPLNFIPLGWFPESKDWSLKRKASFSFFMPYMIFDLSFDNEWSDKLFFVRLFSFMLWLIYAFILITTSRVLVSLISNIPAQSASQNNGIGIAGWAFIVFIITFTLITYAQTIWYVFNKKTSSAHRLFIIGCNLLLGYIVYSEVSQHLAIFSREPLLYILLVVSWIPLSLSVTMILLIISKYILQGTATLVVYFLRAYSTNYSAFTKKLIFGDETKSTYGLKLISLPISEIIYLKELAQKNLENTEKKTTPTAIFLALISTAFAFTPFLGWLKSLFETGSAFVATISQNKGIGGMAFSAFIFPALILIPLSIAIVARQYISLLGNLYIQGILVEACTVAEYAKSELEKEKTKQNKPRTPWQNLLVSFFGKQENE